MRIPAFTIILCLIIDPAFGQGLGQATRPAGATQRKLILPSAPLRYAGQVLPDHIKAVSSLFDNTPDSNPITNDGATLGRVLFYDPTLSANGSTSCASCHSESSAFTDDRRFSK